VSARRGAAQQRGSAQRALVTSRLLVLLMLRLEKMGLQGVKMSVATAARGSNRYALGGLVVAAVVFMFITAAGFSSNEKSAFNGLYGYTYQQLKVALVEKDAALTESLSLLERTQEAQRMQEDALDELRQKLAKYSLEIEEAQEAMRKRDVAVAMKSEADKTAADAVLSAQLCRQEAASALQTKDMQMLHINSALENARREMSGLQTQVQTAEDRIRLKERDLDRAIVEHKAAVNRAKTHMHSQGASVAYLAEKSRQTIEQHGEALEHAKSERSCQPEVAKLTREIEALAKWKREAIHQGCRAKVSHRRLAEA